MVFYLVYTSLPRAEMTPEILSEISAISIENNKENNITGMLLGIENRYLQYLEGDQSAVLKLYNKIKLDGRHHSVTEWISGKAEKRIFGEWSMASWMLSSNELKSHPGLSDINTFLSSTANKNISSERFIEMMKNLLESWISYQEEKLN